MGRRARRCCGPRTRPSTGPRKAAGTGSSSRPFRSSSPPTADPTLRHMGGRRTNLALLVLLAAVFLTGWLAFSFYSWPSRFALLLHSVGGLAIVALLPWKSMLSWRSALRRGAGAAWLSVLLGLLLLVSLAFGFLHTAGWPNLWSTPLLSAVPVLRELTAMELHVGAAIALVPLVVWHLVA